MPPFPITPRGLEEASAHILDDTSSQITYTSFPQATVPSDCAVANICPYQNTIHQTSTLGASAAFVFTDTEIHLYGVTGPGFGEFTVSIDGIVTKGSAYAPTLATRALIFSKTGLSSGGPHSLVLTNSQASYLAFDFASTVLVDETSSPNPTLYSSETRPMVTLTVTAPGGYGNPGVTPVPILTAGGVFGQSDPATAQTKEKTGNDSATGIAIGVTAGVLVILVAAFLRYRLWQYRKRGGTGTAWEAFFGKSRRHAEAKAKAEVKDTWKNWPMLRYVPKYTFEDPAEDADAKEKEEDKRKKERAARAK